MTDPQEVASVIAFAALVIGVPLLSRSLAHLVVSAPMRRVGARMLASLTPATAVDQDALDLYLVVRRQRLCADLRRVEHLVATDTWMSATRQIGNRLAYETLLKELERTPEVLPAIPGIDAINDWTSSGLLTEPAADHEFGRRDPKVEVLDLGWRR